MYKRQLILVVELMNHIVIRWQVGGLQVSSIYSRQTNKICASKNDKVTSSTS